MKEKEDYGQLFLNTEGVPENEDLVYKFPLLRKYEEFSMFKGSPEELNRNKVIRFINLLYSAKSDLVRTYRDDIQIRKEEAARIAGFSTKDKKEWEKVEDDLFNLKNEAIQKMIIRFLIIQNNRLWSIICTIEKSFYETCGILTKPLTDDYQAAVKQEPLRAALIKMNDELSALYDKMFNDNADIKSKLDKSDELRSHFSPEDVAAKLK